MAFIIANWFRGKEMINLQVTMGRQDGRKSQKGILKKATEDELRGSCTWLADSGENFSETEGIKEE